MNRASIVVIWVAWQAASCASIGRADPPSSTGANWRLTFADEFSGTSVDPVKWATQYEWGPTHNHAAYMQVNKVQLDDGAVSLIATRESAPSGKQFTSGVLSSHNTLRVTEGYMEARIKMPTTRGSWPAFWMLSSGWPPEIDIMEYPLFVGQTTNDTYAVNNFWPGTGPPSDFAWIDRNINLSSEYHNYGLQLDSTGLRFFFDGQQVKFSSYKPEFQNMYLIFNYAVGGWTVDGSNPTPPSTADWPNGHVDTTQAEWIRVWERTPTSTTSTWTMNSAATGSWDTAGNWTGGVPDFERQQVVLSTMSGRNAMELRWNNSRTVGDLILSGDTVYTLGQAGGGVESLMFADDTDNFNQIVVTGAGGHVINTRFDLRSSLNIQNQGTSPLVFNGDIVGQARQLTAGGRFVGGALTLSGPGAFVLNGDGTFQSDTLITQGAQVELNGALYADANYLTSTDVTVELGAMLAVAAPDLGLSGLPGEASRVLVNGGTIRFKTSGNVFRGFTIGAEGTTLSVDAGVSVRFTGNQSIASAAGGDLIVQGDGTALLGKSLGGNGDVIKTGGGTLTLSTSNIYAGETIVHGGLLNVLGSTGSGNTIIGLDGTIAGTGSVLGNLVVDGIVAPGPSTGTLGVLGDFTQTATGALQVELQGSSSGLFDVLNVSGNAVVDGKLEIALQNGFVPMEGELFPILSAASVAGSLDLIGDMQGFALLKTTDGLALYYGTLPAGDYDRNGTVEAADYNVWQAAYGATIAAGLGADGNGNGMVDASDFTIWRDNLGATALVEGAASNSLTVPEPTMILFAASALAFVGVLRIRGPR